MNLRNIVSDVSKIPQVQELLKDIHFPVGKQTILDEAQKKGANNNIMSMLQKLPDKQYQSASDVTNELGNANK
jgi:hypothetical protein